MADVPAVAVANQNSDPGARRICVRRKEPAVQLGPVRCLEVHVLECSTEFSRRRLQFASRTINLAMFEPIQHKNQTNTNRQPDTNSSKECNFSGSLHLSSSSQGCQHILERPTKRPILTNRPRKAVTLLLAESAAAGKGPESKRHQNKRGWLRNDDDKRFDALVGTHCPKVC